MKQRLPTVELYRDSTGRWRWRFVAVNGRVLADSGEGYWRRRDAIAGVERVTSSRYSRHDGVLYGRDREATAWVVIP
ncbi:YegP family protein [Thalassiella azotivora]